MKRIGSPDEVAGEYQLSNQTELNHVLDVSKPCCDTKELPLCTKSKVRAGPEDLLIIVMAHVRPRAKGRSLLYAMLEGMPIGIDHATLTTWA